MTKVVVLSSRYNCALKFKLVYAATVTLASPLFSVSGGGGARIFLLSRKY